jgi:two-component system sensor histidine kinase/response regulator
MPDLDGIQTIRLLRNLFASLGRKQIPPMILVSAYSHDEKLSLVSSEIDGLLAKPITARHVYVELARSLGVFVPDVLDATLDQRDKCDWSHFRGIDILLVEDLPINQEVILELLSGVGIYLRIADNGEKALTEVARKVPDLILMDCQMPVMDGFEATRQLRKNPLWKSLPVIALTANAMTEDRQRCLEAGMNTHVAKPLRMADLFAAMQSCLGDWQGAKFASIQSEEVKSPNPAPLSINGIDTIKGMQHVGGNSKLYEKFLREFRERNLSEFPEQFMSASSSEDWVTMIRLVHSLKGLALTLGADELADAAISLETACEKHDLTRLTACLNSLEQSCQCVAKGIDAALGIDSIKTAN